MCSFYRDDLVRNGAGNVIRQNVADTAVRDHWSASVESRHCAGTLAQGRVTLLAEDTADQTTKPFIVFCKQNALVRILAPIY